jgi:signal transduction histidine kinase
MRRRGSITPRHLVVAVLVVVVVNAQLTWWIIFVLGQNRARLGLERERLAAAVRERALGVAESLDAARVALLDAVAVAGGVDNVSIPEPFTTVGVAGPGSCDTGWVDTGDRLVLVLSTAGGCFDAVTAPGWRDLLLDAGTDLEIVERADRPGEVAISVELPPPFEELVVQPQSDVWQETLDDYRGRIAMIVSEGAFFAILLFVLIALLVRTLRREAELERRHRNFLAAITHELKSPLASLRLALETVMKGRADAPSSRRFLDNALDDTQRLQDLVQKVLEATRYDRGGGSLDFRRANLTGVVEDAVATFARRSGPAGVRIDAEFDDDIWAEIDGEAVSIVVSNLLENAAKYGGDEPRVGVRLALQDHHAVLEVSDNGVGIGEDELPYIFDRFYRAGDEMTRTTGGTGLGLYLVRRIVTAHGGRVAVSSTGPGGTTFRVTLPGAQLKETRP